VINSTRQQRVDFDVFLTAVNPNKMTTLWYRSGDGSPSLASLQEKEAVMDLLRLHAKKEGGARRKEAARGKKRVACGEGLVSRETTATWGVRVRH
jgi:hypothetical protein